MLIHLSLEESGRNCVESEMEGAGEGQLAATVTQVLFAGRDPRYYIFSTL